MEGACSRCAALDGWATAPGGIPAPPPPSPRGTGRARLRGADAPRGREGVRPLVTRSDLKASARWLGGKASGDSVELCLQAPEARGAEGRPAGGGLWAAGRAAGPRGLPLPLSGRDPAGPGLFTRSWPRSHPLPGLFCTLSSGESTETGSCRVGACCIGGIGLFGPPLPWPCGLSPGCTFAASSFPWPSTWSTLAPRPVTLQEPLVQRPGGDVPRAPGRGACDALVVFGGRGCF